MPIDKPLRRLPLRDLLTDAEKRVRDVLEHLTSSWIARASDLRDLSRPLRRKSHYPTLATVQHAIDRMVEIQGETENMIDFLFHELEEIREHARRERLNRP
jgi:hypothetical protein